jgi:ubiquinone/menaquinone biosynthesis C-methylase UbiE
VNNDIVTLDFWTAGGIVQEITDETYKNWHETYIRCTTEKERVEAALSKAVSGLPGRGTFLDVGAGDGDLTFRLAKFFGRTCVVEPNKKVRGIFEQRGAEFLEGYFEKIDLGERKFDFILCSHVFWLVRRENQPEFIRKMYWHLNPGGKLAIIMVSPLGQSHDFYKKFFYGYNTTTHDILKDLHVMGLPAEVLPISFEFKTAVYEDFFNICKLFTLESWLHPVNVSDEAIKKDIGDVSEYTKRQLAGIEAFINDNCRRGGEYVMNEEVDVVLVQK